MSRAYNDEWSGRKDLSASAKWRLRHPGAGAKAARKWRLENPGRQLEFNYKWRESHPEMYAAAIKRASAKAAQRKMEKRNKKRGSSIAKNLGNELRRLLERGKDPINLAMSYRVPVSVVLEIKKGLNEF